MKKLAFTIIIAFFALFARSENEIPVLPEEPPIAGSNKQKSKPIYPVISFEGVNFTVSTSLPTNEVQFSVIDEFGGIVYCGMSGEYSKSHYFNVTNLYENNYYIILVCIGDTVWKGEFTWIP